MAEERGHWLVSGGLIVVGGVGYAYEAGLLPGILPEPAILGVGYSTTSPEYQQVVVATLQLRNVGLLPGEFTLNGKLLQGEEELEAWSDWYTDPELQDESHNALTIPLGIRGTVEVSMYSPPMQWQQLLDDAPTLSALWQLRWTPPDWLAQPPLNVRPRVSERHDADVLATPLGVEATLRIGSAEYQL